MKFQKGNRVRCINTGPLHLHLTNGKIYTVVNVFDTEFDEPYLVVLNDLCEESTINAGRCVPLPACGNPNCSCSTGVCERLTFGSGELNNCGYWEFPCWTCARDYEKENPGENVWPPQ
jgi:hypothetical protein